MTRSGRAAVVVVLAACGPAVAPSPLPVASAPVVASAATESAPVASTVASGSASSMRPFREPWPAGDLAARFPQRAKLVGLSSLRVQRDVPVVYEDGFPTLTRPREVVVTAVDDGMARVVIEARNAPVTMMLWAPYEALERVPTRPLRLALRPDVYPDPPASLPARDEVGVWLMPGWHGEAASRREAWREVRIEEGPIHARGWLDERLLGLVYVPDQERAATPGLVRSGTPWRVSPGGPTLAVVGNTDEFVHGIEPLSSPGKAPPGQVLVALRHGLVRVVGLVPASAYAQSHYGMGSLGHGDSWRKRGRHPAALTLAAGTELLDGPAGGAVGRTFKTMDIPDIPGPPPVDGYRRVAFVFDEVGLMPVWVREDRVAALAPPPASASGSAQR